MSDPTEIEWRDLNWNAKTERDLLLYSVGKAYGPDPENYLPEIRACKGREAQEIAQRLQLHSADRVAEIGCGFGFASANLAPRVEALFALDISESFLTQATRELRGFANVEVLAMQAGDLSVLDGRQVNRIFALAVFTQFNFYDIAICLEEVSRVLHSGGRFYFNYKELNTLDAKENTQFQRHRDLYKKNRLGFFRLLQWHSEESLRKLIAAAGLHVLQNGRESENGPFFVVGKA